MNRVFNRVASTSEDTLRKPAHSLGKCLRECRLPEIEVIPESTKHQVKLVKLMKLILKGAGVGTLRDNPHIGAYEKNFKHCRSYPSLAATFIE